LEGNGLYFSENAKYSNDYSYNHKNNVKGIFLALVNLGKVADLPNDQIIERPPDGYDSISRVIHDNKIFII